jgi:uncharacterized membrane protein
MDAVSVFFYTVITFLIILLGICIYAIFAEYNECEAKGGEMIGTGEYYTTTTMVMSGKVLVPITQTHEEVECRCKETGEVIELGE